MLFALAVTWVDFVAYLLSKIHEGRVIAMAAVLYFLLIALRFKETFKKPEKVLGEWDAVVSHFQRRSGAEAL